MSNSNDFQIKPGYTYCYKPNQYIKEDGTVSVYVGKTKFSYDATNSTEMDTAKHLCPALVGRGGGKRRRTYQKRA
jgi:hypothetical protein